MKTRRCPRCKGYFKPLYRNQRTCCAALLHDWQVRRFWREWAKTHGKHSENAEKKG